MHVEIPGIIADIPHAPGTRRRRTPLVFAGVSVMFGLFTWYYMGNALTSCNSVILGGMPGDSTAGLTWSTWLDRSHGPMPGFSHVTNAPFGEHVGLAYHVTTVFAFVVTWLLAKISSPFCAYNLLVFLGYMSSALTMFAFVRWLTQNPWVSVFAAFAIAYTPYHQVSALAHPDCLFDFIFVLYLWAFIAFWRAPNAIRASLMALTTAACAYIDGYFILLGSLLAAATIIGAVSIDLFLRGRAAGHTVRRLKWLGFYALALIVLVSPVILIQIKYSHTIIESLGNARKDIGFQADVYSARPIEYLLPPVNDPLLPHSYKALRDQRLHRSNYYETTLYVGAVVLALATVAWAWPLRRSRRRNVPERIRGFPATFLIAVSTAGVLAALAFSLPPIVQVWGVRVPMPSWFVIHGTAAWRCFARLYLVVETCLVVLAGLGLWFAIRDRRPAVQAGVAAAAVALAFADFMTQSRGLVWSPARAPGVYRWLKAQRNIGTIAEYPFGVGGQIGYYLTYQQIDGKPRLNSVRTDQPLRQLQNDIYGLGDAQTLPVLRALGIGLVLVHDRVDPGGLEFVRYDSARPYAPALWTLLPRDGSGIAPRDAVWTYRVPPGAKATYAVVAARGFDAPVLTDTEMHSALPVGEDGGELRLQLMPGARTRRREHVSLTVTATQTPEYVRLAQRGAKLWEGLLDRPTNIGFTADTGAPIEVQRIVGDSGDIRLSDMRATP